MSPHSTFSIALLALLSAAGISGAEAQQASSCSDTVHGAFDFWIGDWEVHSPDGKLAGHDTVERVAGSCGLLESWTGAGGGTGRSLNFLDPSDGAWHQLWVGSGGLVLRLSGGLEDGSMVLRGRGNGPSRLQRITWTPLDDGRVRQLWEVSEDEGESWKTSFEGLYSKR